MENLVRNGAWRLQCDLVRELVEHEGATIVLLKTGKVLDFTVEQQAEGKRRARNVTEVMFDGSAVRV